MVRAKAKSHLEPISCNFHLLPSALWDRSIPPAISLTGNLSLLNNCATVGIGITACHLKGHSFIKSSVYYGSGLEKNLPKFNLLHIPYSPFKAKIR